MYQGHHDTPTDSERKDDVQEYFDDVIDEVSHKWDDLARKLGFKENRIKGIRSSQPDEDHRCREMLNRWRNREGRRATLQVLQKALIDIGETLTAENLNGPPCTVGDVINTLKDLYATEYANVRPLPWCEDLNLPLREVYTNLQYQRRDDRGRFHDTGTIVSLEDIYMTSKAKAKHVHARPAVRRIRVEGDPGIGKSCSCQKLAHDWSSGKLDIFKAVFFLEMRHMYMSGNVKDAIFEQLLPEDTNMTPNQLWSYIQQNQDDVLFILDGLDELSQTAREVTDVVALIQGKILRNCHVLVTSRPYHCVKDLEKCHEFYKIIGYSEDNSVQFIQKYLNETPESATKLAKQLKHNQNLLRIVVNPLNNVLICIVWEDNEGRLPSSQAELYQVIVYSIAKRFCAKKSIPLEGDEIPSNIKEALRCLGKLSWEGLQQDQLQFNIDDIKEKYGHNADDMLALGLLTRDHSISRIKRTCFCAFLHKTFQEYMAAYYISELVIKDSNSKEGKECLRSLFGMTKATASIVDMYLMSASRKRYREVQNMLLPILGDNLGPLFEMFAEELSRDGCKGQDKDLLSFICITFLGRTSAGRTECSMAGIVAPCLSQHITNDFGEYGAADHAKWFDGLIQVMRCQRTLAMSSDPRYLTVNYREMGEISMKQQQLDVLENALSVCDTISCVTIKSSVISGTSFLLSEENRFPIRIFIPRQRTERVHINFTSINHNDSVSVENMLKELSEIQCLQHVKIRIGCNYCEDDSHYDSLLSNMIMKLGCLRSLSVKIGKCEWFGSKSKWCGNLTATLQSISGHKLEEVKLVHPVNIDLETFDHVEKMVQKLTECVTKNNLLKRLRLSWNLRSFTFLRVYKGTCSSQALSDLCLAIQGNRALKTLTIDGMFSESEGHQEIIDQLMRNKPANFEELRITMFKSEDSTQPKSPSSRKEAKLTKVEKIDTQKTKRLYHKKYRSSIV